MGVVGKDMLSMAPVQTVQQREASGPTSDL